jgi:hypothetical protein
MCSLEKSSFWLNKELAAKKQGSGGVLGGKMGKMERILAIRPALLANRTLLQTPDRWLKTLAHALLEGQENARSAQVVPHDIIELLECSGKGIYG